MSSDPKDSTEVDPELQETVLVTPQWPDTIPPASPAFVSVEDAWIGADFGKYKLISELGRGGMGVVYKARQKGLDRLVAVKMILGSQLAGRDQIERFYAEARATAKLQDPHVVGIHDVGQIAGQHYFAMEFVDGPNLAELCRRERLAPWKAAEIMATVARAVGRLHASGIVHRDLKPSNILIDATGRPLVTDFGLVKLAEGSSMKTCSGTIMGTPGYMAPEQAQGVMHKVGPLSDVYSLGAILYELITGSPPFREATPVETLRRVIDHEPTPPRALNPRVPPPLEMICLKCLEKNPKDRYASAQELAGDLERFIRGEDLAIQRAGLSLRARRWARREPALASRLGGLAVCMAAAQMSFQVFHTVELNVHLKVLGLLASWALASWAFQLLRRRGASATAIGMAWTASDLAFLTVVLLVEDAMISPLIINYPLLVVASALWFDVRLVWASTLIAMAFYGFLALEALIRQGSLSHPSRHLMCLVSLGILGAVMVHLVKRLRKLGHAASDPI